jgi:hypothetical protein
VSSGRFAAAVTWTVDDETSLDVLRGKIEYRPGHRGFCSNIRFIQIAKVERNGGQDYDWQGMEERRNLLRTANQARAGIKGGYFVDHEAFACEPRKPCSPYFRDSWRNPRESGDGFQLGSRSAPASLADYPFGWDVVERISLESCARCVESGEFLACAQWGARWPTQGRRSIDPIRVRRSPSKTFLAALRRFEQYYTKIPPLEAPTLRSSVTSRGFTGK